MRKMRMKMRQKNTKMRQNETKWEWMRMEFGPIFYEKNTNFALFWRTSQKHPFFCTSTFALLKARRGSCWLFGLIPEKKVQKCSQVTKNIQKSTFLKRVLHVFALILHKNAHFSNSTKQGQNNKYLKMALHVSFTFACFSDFRILVIFGCFLALFETGFWALFCRFLKKPWKITIFETSNSTKLSFEQPWRKRCFWNPSLTSPIFAILLYFSSFFQRFWPWFFSHFGCFYSHFILIHSHFFLILGVGQVFAGSFWGSHETKFEKKKTAFWTGFWKKTLFSYFFWRRFLWNPLKPLQF